MTDIPGWTDTLPYALFRANQSVQRLLAEAVSDLGATITQLGIAVHLDALGAMSGSELARRLRVTPQSASTALGQLEALGWVRREPHPQHGRVILYLITPTGHEGAASARQRLASVQTELRGLLGHEQMARATEVLAALANRVDAGAINPARR
ncbi:MarR family transcriptional regulator [Microbacterium sp. NPDC096154]|uniref:MarR family winged helix-turn-helix transcriptional regulator n=1 Tax=Microbacterium sp. NPDC096154 TaxID=3155549 RepID=UPI003321B2ED